jgi:hypothetical protein
MFTAFLFIGFTVLLLGAVVAAIVWTYRHGMRAREAAAELAKQLGWQVVLPITDLRRPWYGGVAQGRRVAVQMVPLRVGLSHQAGPRNQLHLRIVMEVALREPFDGSAMRGGSDRSDLVSFEQALAVENPHCFGPAAREAILRFVAEGYPTGVVETRYRANPGTRNLWVADRRKVPETFLPSTVLPGAKAIVHHDHPNTNLSAADLQKLLYQMAQIAVPIEQGH